MPDSNLGPRWRHIASIIRGEQAISAAAYTALRGVLAYAARTLETSGYDAGQLSIEASGWRTSSNLAQLLGEVEGVFLTAWSRADRGVIDPSTYATLHIEAVTNRLAGVPDEVFDAMRLELVAGREAHDSIPQLAARVDALLSDDERWKGRATTIARTETIGAANMGARGAAGATAAVLDVDPSQVVKEWLATNDGHTRPTHQEADGQQVLGLDTPFVVGGSDLDVPGDPSGDAGEVINCRCTVLFHYPGDPGYPTGELGVGRIDSIGDAPSFAPADYSTPSQDQFVPIAETPAAQAPIPEAPVDPGPGNDMERMARALTPEELAREANRTRGSKDARAVARAELKRRGLAAAGTQEDSMADDETRTGVAVVALPAADDPVHGIGDEDKHATLLFYGDTTEVPELTEEFRQTVLQALQTYAATSAPWVEPVSGVDSLGPEGARVWMLTGPSINGVRDAILDTDTEAAPPESVEQFPTYTPHVTIGYADVEASDAPPSEDVTVQGELDPETEAAAAAVTEITFDRLALWWAGEQTEVPLAGGQNQEDPVETDESVTAAAGDPAPAPTSTTQEMDAGEPAPVVPELPDGTPMDEDRFYGVMVVEDSQTGDRRVFAPGAIRWNTTPLPIPLGWQVQDAPGHDGSVVCGRIDTISRMGNLITYTGAWDLDGPGWETRRLVEGRFLTGLSVDTDDCEVQVVDSEGNPIDPFDMMFGEGEEPLLLVEDSRIRSAAMCRVPAFVEAFIANGVPPAGWAGERPGVVAPVGEEAPAEETPAPSEEEVVEELVASAGRAQLPAASRPPLSDFSDPGLSQPTPLTITDDGRVFGHLATWGTCHIGFDGQCVTPPFSMAAYAYFLTGEADTDGGTVPVGQLTMATGHASPSLSARPAAAHYDDTGTPFADVSCGDDGIGIWFSGRLRAGVTPDQVTVLKASGALSGDWRRIAGNLELVAALAVNVPGFPIPRLGLAASGDVQTALVASGVVTQEVAVVTAGAGQLLTYADVRREALAVVDRQARALAAARRLRATRVTQAQQRLAAQRQARVQKATSRINGRK